jgi:hypothetical protein
VTDTPTYLAPADVYELATQYLPADVREAAEAEARTMADMKGISRLNFLPRILLDHLQSVGIALDATLHEAA